MSTAAIERLAAADFSAVADSFAAAGYLVQLPQHGVMQLRWPGGAPRRSLLISVGVHGDETAPIEMLAHLLLALAAAPYTLQVDLLVVVGNPDAIAAGRRYLDSDLNRLFLAQRSDEGGREAARADLLMRATDAFFAAAAGERWHLDLHTAIRASRYPTFAILPDVFGASGKAILLDWLACAGIEAVILNRKLAGTYSAYSAVQFGAFACTAELGQIGLLGQNDLTRFAATQAALLALLTGAPQAAPARPQVFTVAQELRKLSDQFRLSFDAATENFTPLAPGAVIAEDGDQVYRVGEQIEYVVFPNPRVANGKRAGLMVVKCPLTQAGTPHRSD